MTLAKGVLEIKQKRPSSLVQNHGADRFRMWSAVAPHLPNLLHKVLLEGWPPLPKSASWLVVSHWAS